MAHVELYDTTLRDGTQQEGISLSVEDKLKITKRLDALGIDYIEGGWPGANPKDAEFFEKAKLLELNHSRIVAFGSTRRPNGSAKHDPSLKHVLEAETSVVTLVGKTWDMQVTDVLRTNLEENLAMISDSIDHLKANGRKVFLDAEHFFDGYKANSDYATQCVRVAIEAGADCVVLCDTNGGTLPHEVSDIVTKLLVDVPEAALAIHPHNDGDVAVANALAAIMAGVTQVQGTINGVGERCGNANLLSVIADLKIKMGIDCVTDEQLGTLAEISNFVYEIINRTPNPYQPYVGSSAFSHKAGLHASAVAKVAESYQHIEPERVGNTNHILISELAGRSNVLQKMDEMNIPASPEVVQTALATIKQQEARGFQYEGADASFEMLVRRSLPDYVPAFELVDFAVTVEKHRTAGGSTPDNTTCNADIKIQVDGNAKHNRSEGNGPVNALDSAARKSLLEFYPNLSVVKLLDYKVRVVDQGSGTESMVRVLIDSTDGDLTWQTVGCSADIIEASWMALQDSLEWWLLGHET